MRVRYETWHGAEDLPPHRFAHAVRTAAQMEKTAKLCEIGGGANPILPLDFANDAGIQRYAVVDVAEDELAKAPDGYEKIVADISHERLVGVGTFDLVVSHTVAEHVTDPVEFHRSIFELLSPGGQAMHFFPTFYDPVFVVNRLLPEAVSEGILQRIQPNRAQSGDHGKFPAYYRWCRGPTRRQLARLTNVGFRIDEYVGIFGHGYFHPLPAVHRLERKVSEMLVRRPLPWFTSYAWIVLSRPQ